MKKIDAKSVILAGVVAAVGLSLLVNYLDTSNTNKNNFTFYAALGFFLGVGVQVIERWSGVS